MKFVDEVPIWVEAGKGGDGALSFRREKNIAKGGPDGGNGGDGGCVYLQAVEDLNTLVDFRHQRHYRAKNGFYGMGKNRIGKKGADLILNVPVGTLVYDKNTHELIGDLLKANQKLLVAQGGEHGLGNSHFKSSINRAPRRTTKGGSGEQRELFLELKLLADVGLLGLPNAGKSTFIRAISSAKPRIADYPFTTLHPHLGVVKLELHRSFVVADIPGIIEGAAGGAGLGIKFLKHLSRTSILLHIVDVAPTNEIGPIDAVRVVTDELKQFDPELAEKERWLVFNKIDFLPPEQRETYCQGIVNQLSWKGPIFLISALNRQGTADLCGQIMEYSEKQRALESEKSK